MDKISLNYLKNYSKKYNENRAILLAIPKLSAITYDAEPTITYPLPFMNPKRKNIEK
jgi:hypothetical protein